MKVIYYMGESINRDTFVKRGTIYKNEQGIFIESAGEKLALNDIKKVELIRINAVGTMVRVFNSSDTIFLAVPRIFINKGTGFVIINYLKTRALSNLLRLERIH